MSFLNTKRSKLVFNSVDSSMMFNHDEVSIIERDNESVKMLDVSQTGMMLNS